MITHISTTSFTGLGHRLISFHKASIANVIIESLDEIHSCLLRILMWNYRSKVNYLCVKLRVHFRVFRKKLQEVVLAVLSGPSLKSEKLPKNMSSFNYTMRILDR